MLDHFLKVFSKNFILQKNHDFHFKESHPEVFGQVKYQCFICDSVFRSKKARTRHLNQVHDKETSFVSHEKTSDFQSVDSQLLVTNPTATDMVENQSDLKSDTVSSPDPLASTSVTTSISEEEEDGNSISDTNQKETESSQAVLTIGPPQRIGRFYFYFCPHETCSTRCLTKDGLIYHLHSVHVSK